MPISLENALELLLDRTRVCYPIRLPLIHCYSRVLAEDILPQMTYTPFSRSPLDGYAIRKEDIRRASSKQPVFLKKVVPAVAWTPRIIGASESERVMAGVEVPDGTNAVVQLEDTLIEQGQVVMKVEQQENGNACLEDEEYLPGDVVLVKGTYLQEGAMGILAMMGRSKLKIYSKPKVGILTTGRELSSVSAPLQPGKIHDTNSYMLDAKVRMAGGISISLGHVEDDVEAIIERFHTSQRLPVYIVTGSASVGDCDFAAKIFEQLHVTVLFDKVAIKPGMTVLAGDWQGSLVIALSGTSEDCSVAFEVLVRPLLRKMAGFKQWEHTKVMVRLSGSLAKPSPLRRFIWARCVEKNGAILATPLPYQQNGMLRSILEANALLDIPADGSPLKEGQKVKALWLPSWF